MDTMTGDDLNGICSRRVLECRAVTMFPSKLIAWNAEWSWPNHPSAEELQKYNSIKIAKTGRPRLHKSSDLMKVSESAHVIPGRVAAWPCLADSWQSWPLCSSVANQVKPSCEDCNIAQYLLRQIETAGFLKGISCTNINSTELLTATSWKFYGLTGHLPRNLPWWIHSNTVKLYFAISLSGEPKTSLSSFFW